ncbi:CPBP family intramembrane metalloprotease [Candidatus Thorarchaeota archaeon]|nr:MAG: CPBP family intramembrane metalloprotease [Candidatus Thorarchaeota archaeon]
MVLKDPDEYEMEQVEGIGIFEPGSYIERNMNWDNFFRVLLYTAGAIGLFLISTVIVLIPLIAYGFIQVDLITLEVTFGPWAFLIASFAEIAFFIPPLYYIKKRGLSFRSLGIKTSKLSIDILLGLGVGAVMLLANLLVTWLTFEVFPVPEGTQMELTFASSIEELIGWFIVMFLIVGTSEELLFRGFLQRRMEMYFKQSEKKRYRLLALVISSLVFAAIHLEPLGIPTRFMLGMFLGYLAQERNYSLVAPAVAHGLNNSIAVLLAFLGF